MEPRTPMDRVEELFEAALDRPSAERAAFLDQACDDELVRAEVDSLLAAEDEAGDFLHEAALGGGATWPETSAAGLEPGRSNGMPTGNGSHIRHLDVRHPAFLDAGSGVNPLVCGVHDLLEVEVGKYRRRDTLTPAGDGCALH